MSDNYLPLGRTLFYINFDCPICGWIPPYWIKSEEGKWMESTCDRNFQFKVCPSCFITFKGKTILDEI